MHVDSSFLLIIYRLLLRVTHILLLILWTWKRGAVHSHVDEFLVCFHGVILVLRMLWGKEKLRILPSGLSWLLQTLSFWVQLYWCGRTCYLWILTRCFNLLLLMVATKVLFAIVVKFLFLSLSCIVTLDTIHHVIITRVRLVSRLSRLLILVSVGKRPENINKPLLFTN